MWVGSWGSLSSGSSSIFLGESLTWTAFRGCSPKSIISAQGHTQAQYLVGNIWSPVLPPTRIELSENFRLILCWFLFRARGGFLAVCPTTTWRWPRSMLPETHQTRPRMIANRLNKSSLLQYYMCLLHSFDLDCYSGNTMFMRLKGKSAK